jgi:hypothetical protein
MLFPRKYTFEVTLYRVKIKEYLLYTVEKNAKELISHSKFATAKSRLADRE